MVIPNQRKIVEGEKMNWDIGKNERTDKEGSIFLITVTKRVG